MFPSPYGAWVSSIVERVQKAEANVSVPLRDMGFIPIRGYIGFLSPTFPSPYGAWVSST